MIQHVVLLALEPGHDPAELSEIMQGLEALTAEIAGFTGFQHGPNKDFEGKSPGFPYGFICGFDSAEALHAYAMHPTHQALGARLVALCTGGADGIMVADLEVAHG